MRISGGYQRLDHFRQVAREGIAHLNDGWQVGRPQLQHFGQILASVLAPREIQRNPALLDNPYQPAGEQSGQLPFLGA